MSSVRGTPITGFMIRKESKGHGTNQHVEGPVEPGDEVVTSAMSFFAAANMILKIGAKPVFVDCELATRNIDLAQLEAAITPRARAGEAGDAGADAA